MHKKFQAVLLAGVTLSALSGAAFAAAKPSQPDPAAQAKLDSLQQQIQDLNSQLQQIKQAQAAQAQALSDADAGPALADLKRSTSDQYVDLNNQIAAQNKASVDNGRLQITSADGRFSAAVRGLFQFDTGYYSQSHAASQLPAAYGPDLGSGSNFRRAYIGLSGKLFGDWSYNLNGDFGGSGGTETPLHIQSVYLQYDGLGPWAFRVGAYPPPANIEDGTSAGDTIFLERNAPSDLQRNIAGGDGRDAFTILYAAPTIFGALSYTGDKVQDGTKALAAGTAVAANFDEQSALLGRLSWLPIATQDVKWVVGVNGTHVFKLPDLIANGTSANASNTPGQPALHTITLSDPPELTVDSNGTLLATTGALPAGKVDQWGAETALQFENVYGQAGYYNFQVQRSPLAYTQFTSATTSAPTIVQPTSNDFSAWYAQVAWALTGETKAYNVATGSFNAIKPEHNFSLDGSGWGAFELAARFSDLNLNDHAYDTSSVVTTWAATGAKTYTYYNTVRGGDQRIATLGVNWYPNSVIKFALNYELVQNSRLQSTALPAGIAVTTAGTPVLPTVNGGQNLQTIALRAQLSL